MPGRGHSWPYVAPFATLMLLLAAGQLLPHVWAYAIRAVLVLVITLAFSRRLISLRPARWFSSVLIGLAVFAIWIAPDLLLPGYRGHWLFQNAFTGAASTGVAAAERANWLLLVFRVAGSALLVPVVEELFWRAWLMRWLVSARFESVPLGAYAARAFWITAILFASEHGAYWDVGLAAGVAYNWWMVRTGSLADCILAHAVTNSCLAAWVLGAGQWQYWL
ncbi:MAG: CAAX prenyl protease-related protein [Bryobacteraceae bacterium]